MTTNHSGISFFCSFLAIFYFDFFLFFNEIYSDKNQPKPIWLSSGVEDSTLKRQPDLSLDLPAPANGNARSLDSDDSPLSTRKARPHSRHSRDQLEKEKEKERVDKEKAKESELSIFGASKMAKSPSFGNSSIFSSPSSSQPVVPNPNPTPRRGRLADSSAASLAPNPASNSANNSNVLYSNLTANSPATDKAQKKRVTALDIGESSTDCILIRNIYSLPKIDIRDRDIMIILCLYILVCY